MPTDLDPAAQQVYYLLMLAEQEAPSSGLASSSTGDDSSDDLAQLEQAFEGLSASDQYAVFNDFLASRSGAQGGAQVPASPTASIVPSSTSTAPTSLQSVQDQIQGLWSALDASGEWSSDPAAAQAAAAQINAIQGQLNQLWSSGDLSGAGSVESAIQTELATITPGGATSTTPGGTTSTPTPSLTPPSTSSVTSVGTQAAGDYTVQQCESDMIALAQSQGGTVPTQPLLGTIAQGIVQGIADNFSGSNNIGNFSSVSPTEMGKALVASAWQESKFGTNGWDGGGVFQCAQNRLNDYNSAHGTSYSENDLNSNAGLSVTVGLWSMANPDPGVIGVQAGNVPIPSGLPQQALYYWNYNPTASNGHANELQDYMSATATWEAAE